MTKKEFENLVNKVREEEHNYVLDFVKSKLEEKKTKDYAFLKIEEFKELLKSINSSFTKGELGNVKMLNKKQNKRLRWLFKKYIIKLEKQFKLIDELIDIWKNGSEKGIEDVERFFNELLKKDESKVNRFIEKFQSPINIEAKKTAHQLEMEAVLGVEKKTTRVKKFTSTLDTLNNKAESFDRKLSFNGSNKNYPDKTIRRMKSAK